MTAESPDSCTYCRRPRRRHWRRRLCGPLTGTGPGPMTPAERERYLAANSGADPDYPDVSGGGVPHLPVPPPPHPIG